MSSALSKFLSFRSCKYVVIISVELTSPLNFLYSLSSGEIASLRFHVSCVCVRAHVSMCMQMHMIAHVVTLISDPPVPLPAAPTLSWQRRDGGRA
jgi:hypothetical protein